MEKLSHPEKETCVNPVIILWKVNVAVLDLEKFWPPAGKKPV